MTNKDKYLKDGVDVMQMLHDYNQTGQKCQTVWKWLEQQVKPTLTEDEKVILKNIFRGFDKIRRTSIPDGRHLEVYNGYNKIWYEYMYQHLFQFIQPRRRI